MIPGKFLLVLNMTLFVATLFVSRQSEALQQSFTCGKKISLTDPLFSSRVDPKNPVLLKQYTNSLDPFMTLTIPNQSSGFLVSKISLVSLFSKNGSIYSGIGRPPGFLASTTVKAIVANGFGLIFFPSDSSVSICTNNRHYELTNLAGIFRKDDFSKVFEKANKLLKIGIANHEFLNSIGSTKEKILKAFVTTPVLLTSLAALRGVAQEKNGTLFLREIYEGALTSNADQLLPDNYESSRHIGYGALTLTVTGITMALTWHPTVKVYKAISAVSRILKVGAVSLIGTTNGITEDIDSKDSFQFINSEIASEINFAIDSDPETANQGLYFLILMHSRLCDDQDQVQPLPPRFIELTSSLAHFCSL